MARIRHIAIASDEPAKAAAFFKAAFGLREVRNNGIDAATGVGRDHVRGDGELELPGPALHHHRRRRALIFTL